MKPILGRKIRFALAGCGRIANNHFESISQHGDECQLVDICDPNTDALSAAHKKTKAAPHETFSAMLDSTSADCIILTTPSGLHASQTITAAASGRHVITEKPMATQWSDGLSMVDAVDKAGVRLFVVKQNRTNPTLRLLKQAIKNNRFGRVYSVAVNVFWTRPQEYYDSAQWRGTWEFDGGALMNQASHYIDLLDWLIGPVESVMAYTETLGRKIEVEDSGVVALRWRNGALGTVNVTMLTYPKNLEGSITILGEQGSVRIGGVAVNDIQHWEFSEVHNEDANIELVNYETTSVYGHGHPIYYENVLRTLRGIDLPETDGAEGLKSLELLIAMYLSSREGRRVTLPLSR